MKVSKPSHKILIRSLFFKEGKPVEFSLDKLPDAGSALKKIEECSEPVKDKPNLIQFNDKEIEFTPSEIAILKPLFDGKEKWSVTEYEVVGQVKNLFDGKAI